MFTTDTVKLGDKSKSVTLYKRILKGRGWNVTISSTYDAAFRPIVKAFQKKHGLTVDGIIGPKTAAKIIDLE